MKTKLSPPAQADPDELAELRARLHARIIENIRLGQKADERRVERHEGDRVGAAFEQHETHIQLLQRRLGDLEALATALLVIIDPIRILDPEDKRLDRYNNDDSCGTSKQEQLELTDLGNVPRGGNIAAEDFLVAVIHQPYYCLLNGHKCVAPGTPPNFLL